MSQPLLHRCDRRTPQAMQLVAMIMEVIAPHIKDASHGQLRLELMDLMWSQGATVVTEADRLAAGLHPRNHRGLTLEDIVVVEAYQRQRLLDAMPNHILSVDGHGLPVVIGLDGVDGSQE